MTAQSKTRLQFGLTTHQLAAIDRIGRRRRTSARVGQGKQVSAIMFNRLKKMHLVMWLDEAKKECMLTAQGERVFTRLHPRSKYRIN